MRPNNKNSILLLLCAIAAGAGGWYLSTSHIQSEISEYKSSFDAEREAVDVLPAVLDAIARPQAPPWLNLARLPALLTDDDRVLTPEQRLVAVHVLRACDEDEVALDALVVLCSFIYYARPLPALPLG